MDIEVGRAHAAQFKSASGLLSDIDAWRGVIKGNISRNGRIYRMPGSRDYEKVVINPAKGDRYFCSEDEARPGSADV
jgi:hypothetical protein